MSGTIKTDIALVYVCDKGFVFPTLVSAIHASRNSSVTDVADIIVMLVGIDSRFINKLNYDLKGLGITFVRLDSSTFKTNAGTHFNKTHVPRTALARFGLLSSLPETYKNIVYVDGDTLITGNIGGLLTTQIEDGFIASANEFIWLCEDDKGTFWREHKKYLEGLGIVDPSLYFNSGVLSFSRETWSCKARQCIEYFNNNSRACKYHDQSALNAVFRGARKVLHPTYNFTTEYMALGIDKAHDPKIVHFTGGMKPWLVGGTIWEEKYGNIYDSIEKEFSLLKGLRLTMNKGAKYSLLREHRNKKLKQSVFFPWRSKRRIDRFEKYIGSVEFIV